MKKPSKKQVNIVLITATALALMVAGMVSTLKYQQFISNVKAQGVAEYKKTDCLKFARDGATWLECDIKD